MGRPNLEEFSTTLIELGKQDKDILVVTSDSRGSAKLVPFGEQLPKQIDDLLGQLDLARLQGDVGNFVHGHAWRYLDPQAGIARHGRKTLGNRGHILSELRLQGVYVDISSQFYHYYSASPSTIIVQLMAGLPGTGASLTKRHSRHGC